MITTDARATLVYPRVKAGRIVVFKHRGSWHVMYEVRGALRHQSFGPWERAIGCAIAVSALRRHGWGR